MFSVKICGVTSAEDAEACRRAGADAIGLNFYANSPRCVRLEQAAEIAAAAGPEVAKVGVFVHAALDDVLRTAETVPLDAIQLHGDEGPAWLRALAGWPVIRAFRNADGSWRCVHEFLELVQREGHSPLAVLLDAYSTTQYGGTGFTLDWGSLAGLGRAIAPVPWILAGGLSAENVERAILAACPTAVDVASGVEASPGRKDPQQVWDFVQRARGAFAALGR